MPDRSVPASLWPYFLPAWFSDWPACYVCQYICLSAGWPLCMHVLVDHEHALTRLPVHHVHMQLPIGATRATVSFEQDDSLTLYSSSPKSDIALALSAQGFHTTASGSPFFCSVIASLRPASTICKHPSTVTNRVRQHQSSKPWDPITNTRGISMHAQAVLYSSHALHQDAGT